MDKVYKYVVDRVNKCDIKNIEKIVKRILHKDYI